MDRHVISIDGPTASGKTTLGVALCARLGGAFLDTGLTYRGLAHAVDQDGVTPESAPLDTFLAHLPMVHVAAGDVAHRNGSQPERVLYQGTDITSLIFADALEPSLRAVAGNPLWRAQVLAMHRRIVSAHSGIGGAGVVAVGRDVAVNLLTNATLSVYLTASHAVRRERRRAQYRDAKGKSIVVGPPTERDLESRTQILAMANGMGMDSTHLPASAVLAAVNRKLRSLAHV